MKKKGTFKKIFKFISDVISWTCLCILILIGVCIIWYIIQTKVYASKGEKYKPYISLYTIISPSMEPKIKVYDVIVDTRVDSPEEIQVGDIITFVSTGSLSNGMTITHRVIDIINKDGKISYVTKGDNNDSPDGALAHYENVLGKTILKIPMLGKVQFLLANKGVWIIVVMIPALGIIAYDILKLFKNSNLKSKLEDMVDDEPKKDKNKQKELEEKRKEEIKEKLLLEEIKDNVTLTNIETTEEDMLNESSDEEQQEQNDNKKVDENEEDMPNESSYEEQQEQNDNKEVVENEEDMPNESSDEKQQEQNDNKKVDENEEDMPNESSDEEQQEQNDNKEVVENEEDMPNESSDEKQQEQNDSEEVIEKEKRKEEIEKDILEKSAIEFLEKQIKNSTNHKEKKIEKNKNKETASSTYKNNSKNAKQGKKGTKKRKNTKNNSSKKRTNTNYDDFDDIE